MESPKRYVRRWFKGVKSGDLQILKKCLKKHNFDINMRLGKEKDRTALMVSSMKGNVQIVEFLIGRGCLLNLKDADECTAIMLACKAQKAAVIKCLIRYEQISLEEINDPRKSHRNCTKKSRRCLCPVHIAAKKNYYSLMKALIKQSKNFLFDSKCPCDEMTPMMIACKKGHARIIRQLIDVGVDVNQPYVDENDQMTAKHFAETNVKNTQMNCDPSAEKGRGKTPLDLAQNATIQKSKDSGRKPLGTIEDKTCKALNLLQDAKPMDPKELQHVAQWSTTCEISSSPTSSICDLPSSPTSSTSGFSIDHRYKMTHPVGMAIVINNNMFEERSGLSNRDGSLVDLENTRDTLSMSHGLQVHTYNDLTRDQMVACLEHYSNLEGLGQFSCLLVFIMSHGKRGHVYGVDGEVVPIIDLTAKFKASRCRPLKGRPKGFVMVACQSDEAGGGNVTQSDLIPVEEEDYIVSYSTTPGSTSYRSIYHGTPYIHFLMNNLRKYAERRSVSEILRNTNKHVRDVTHQPCVWFSTLLKKFQLKLNTNSRRKMVSITRFKEELNEVVTSIQVSNDDQLANTKEEQPMEWSQESSCPDIANMHDFSSLEEEMESY